MHDVVIDDQLEGKIKNNTHNFWISRVKTVLKTCSIKPFLLTILRFIMKILLNQKLSLYLLSVRKKSEYEMYF